MTQPNIAMAHGSLPGMKELVSAMNQPNDELLETEVQEFMSESRLDEVVKEFVQYPKDDEDHRKKMIVLSLVSDLRNCRAELEQTREELKQAKTDAFVEREKKRELVTELEQVKAERDLLQLNLETQVRHFNDTTEELEKAYEDCETIESELAAKDKVLEHVAAGYAGPKTTKLVRSILSQYRKGDVDDEQLRST